MYLPLPATRPLRTVAILAFILIAFAVGAVAGRVTDPAARAAWCAATYASR